MEVKVGSLRMSMLSGRVGFRDVWVFFFFHTNHVPESEIIVGSRGLRFNLPVKG